MEDPCRVGIELVTGAYTPYLSILPLAGLCRIPCEQAVTSIVVLLLDLQSNSFGYIYVYKAQLVLVRWYSDGVCELARLSSVE